MLAPGSLRQCAIARKPAKSGLTCLCKQNGVDTCGGIVSAPHFVVSYEACSSLTRYKAQDSLPVTGGTRL